jgi:acetolactate synthase small subunit
MHTFSIRYRNTQGTLMRILNAASRRALDIPYMQAEPNGHDHKVTLMLEVNPKQIGQLSRDWYAVVDVIDVHTAISVQTSGGLAENTQLPHPPAAARAAGVGTQQALA